MMVLLLEKSMNGGLRKMKTLEQMTREMEMKSVGSDELKGVDQRVIRSQ